MTYEEALAFLDSRIRLGMRPGLERITALMDLLDNPQLSYPTIHVTGTNGKFSVVQMSGAILAAQGLTVGAYTSPHLESYCERIALAGEPVSEEAFAGVLEYLVPFVEIVDSKEHGELAHFELLTAMAFELWAQKPVHVGVVEVGLGGEWDATNVIDAKVSVVARVDRDHVREFGDDPSRAAWEKAGVIKQDATVVSGVEPAALASIIEERARERGAARVVRLGEEFDVTEGRPAVGGQLCTVRGLYTWYEDIFLPLFGLHQASNAALAIAACEAFTGGPIDVDLVRGALREVRVPGRLEIVGRHPLVVLEGGHNPDAARATVKAVTEEFSYDRLHLVVGMYEDKLIEEVLSIVAPIAHDFVVTAPGFARAAAPERLARALDEIGVPIDAVEVEPEMRAAVRRALEHAAESDMVLVFGSLELVGDLRGWLRERVVSGDT